MRSMKRVLAVGAVMLMLLACGPLSGLLGSGYEETFDSGADWQIETTGGASAEVEDGAFNFTVSETEVLYWIMADSDGYADGTWSVDVTQTGGPDDAGYGLVFRETNDSFYLFQVSTDGFTWIGLCQSGCEEWEMLVGGGWELNDAVRTGLNATNRLRVEATGPDMVFYVNDVEVGSATDSTFSSGDLGMLVETFSNPGDVTVEFDNLSFQPAEE